jgi:HK97 family phage portal protein
MMEIGMTNALSWVRGWLSPVPRIEAKSEAPVPLVAIEARRRPRWSARNATAFAREGFAANPVGYRCVRMIAEAAASVPWLLFEGRVEHSAHPFLDLLARPNVHADGHSWSEQLYGQLLVTGNAYAEAIALKGALRELHVLRSDRMKVVPGPDGWPEAYEYSVSGRIVRFRQDQPGPVRPILHLRLFDPVSDHYGLSPFAPAAASVDIHNEAAAWNKALLDNSARPSGALVYRGPPGSENLSDGQFARLKRELEQTYQGSANAGRPLVLEGGLDWKEMALSPKDMEHIEAKHAAARDIALAFGVPPMLLGIPGDNTYANYAEANRTFWRQTVLPLVHRTSRALARWLAPAFGTDLRLTPDTDGIEALSTEREALWSRVEKASFLTLNEKRQAIGYAPIPGGDHL